MIHHIELRVTEFERHHGFWEWLMVEMLGFERHQQWSNGRSWHAGVGEPYVVLAEGDTLRVPDHIAFAVAESTDTDAIWDGVEAHGGSRLYTDEHPYAGGPEHYAAYFLDPGGVKIEVVWERARRLA